ncbi:MAG: 50S ribosomal protein L21 [Legionellaceae bacterium]
MYAVIISGGKQYRVQEGQTLKLEKLTAETGTEVNFDQVLMIANENDIKVGTPLLENSKVRAEVIRHGRNVKVKIIKFRRRKHHKKQMGHRQHFTEVKITHISA